MGNHCEGRENVRMNWVEFQVRLKTRGRRFDHVYRHSSKQIHGGIKKKENKFNRDWNSARISV